MIHLVVNDVHDFDRSNRETVVAKAREVFRLVAKNDPQVKSDENLNSTIKRKIVHHRD